MKNEAGVLYDKKRERERAACMITNTHSEVFTQQNPRFSAQGNVKLNSLSVGG